ncbi:hypothetical protein LWI28_015912 [Acer negundo]|uniref:Sec-independent protein translocase protein TATB, chloroplastic n=1 Tax=Acer negundo TaxID=4023 RepID=A0AAD5IEH4_ACENE|nr:hypothetical protein LWI28_015912 [Acer negundo]KAK4839120.1 hypothetical protein QYF36_019283 [Acer negundo]
MTTGLVMASPISCLCSSPTCSSSSSSSFTVSKPSIYYSSSSSLVSHPKKTNICLSTLIPQLGFSSWSGLKHLGVPVTPKSLNFLEKKRKCKGMVVHASLFGVGAPEALVIGVVALLVFGPKGLAEVARNLGKTLRAFQPTIRELQDVSRDFKSTLEREIGLDDISSSAQNTYTPYRDNNVSTPPVASPNGPKDVADPNGSPSPNRAYTSDEYLKITEEQLKASAAQQQEQSPPQEESQFEPQTQPQATVKEPTSTSPPLPQKPENLT